MMLAYQVTIVHLSVVSSELELKDSFTPLGAIAEQDQVPVLE